jgi:hypothetical protein
MMVVLIIWCKPRNDSEPCDVDEMRPKRQKWIYFSSNKKPLTPKELRALFLESSVENEIRSDSFCKQL